MTREYQFNILLQDRCTKKEAEDRLKRNTVIIYEDPAEYIQTLKDNDCYEGETIEDLRRGLPDLSMVVYEGHEYLIAYEN